MAAHVRGSRIAVGVVAVIALAGCSSAAGTAHPPAARPLKDLVLTTDLMPKSMAGWTAVATGTDPDIAMKLAMANPHQSPRPASDAACRELEGDLLPQITEVPLDESGAEITGPDTGTPWRVDESVYRYAGGVAKTTVDTIRGMATRCATQDFVTVAVDHGPGLGDDSVTVHRTDDPRAVGLNEDEYTVIIRSGDDLIVIGQHVYNDTIVTSKVWSAATAAYGAYSRG